MQIQYKNMIRLAVIVAMVYLGFRFLLPLFFPFLLAWCIARLLRRPVRFLYQKCKFRPALSGGLLLVVFLTGAGSILFYVIRLLLQQFTLLAGNYSLYTAEWNAFLEQVCGYMDVTFRLQTGSAFSVLSDSFDGLILFFQEELLPFLTKNSLKAAVSVTELVAAVVLTVVATLLLLTESVKKGDPIERKKEKLKQRAVSRRLCAGRQEGETEEQWFLSAWQQIRRELSSAGIAYIKTQAILIALVSLVCGLGLLLLKNPYAILFGVGIGIFDAFPILGSGLVLIPWSVISFFQGNVFAGAVLLTLYGLCQFFREYLEPRLLGDKMGLRPIHSLMAVYVGYELFGISGLFLGPIGLVLIRSIWKVTGKEGLEK